jgi:hypothetical protein
MTLTAEATAHLDAEIEGGWRVMTRRNKSDEIKFRRVYRDSEGYYFRWGKGRRARTNIVSAHHPFGDWVYTGDYVPHYQRTER